MDLLEREAFSVYAQLPKFKRKVNQALVVIREALKIGPAYVAVSWGKDSVVMLHLCQQVQPDILAISFSHPERSMISNYEEVIDQYRQRFGLNLKDIALAGDHVPAKVEQAKLWDTWPVGFIGLRKEECDRRSMALIKYGLLHQYQSGSRSTSWRCCPVGWFGWRDIWAYICANNLPYLSIYDQLSRDRGRTTDHLSKTMDKAWQQRRFEEIKLVAPEYAKYLQENHAENFQ
jgi:3'-phosphoadenosine 5'-phosphosulfate sulfotransferase (PAPS reductase)/FAD synthetase